MGLGEVPSGERVRIGFFGMRNAGKSSLVNAVTGQDLAVVSSVAGTTTDPVSKAMELLPLGPVVIVDTPGMDDEGALGGLRVRKARQALRGCDVAVLVVDVTRGLTPADRVLLEEFEHRKVPHVVAYNKADLAHDESAEVDESCLLVSAKEGVGVNALKEHIGDLARKAEHQRVLVADLVDAGDMVVLVTPIDASAPKGRLILPQQLVLRDLLDTHASAVVCQPGELASVLDGLRRSPRLVVTDSQAFAEVAKTVPREVPLTSFSILMARYKGDLPSLVRGAKALEKLADESHVLISEGCTHHRQCEDIGTVKLPGWIRAYVQAEPTFSFSSGGEFPDDLSSYDLVVHCGGCMLNEREMAHRMRAADEADVPMVNYGVAIAQMNGILERSIEPLGL